MGSLDVPDLNIISFIEDVKKRPELINDTSNLSENEKTAIWASLGKKHGLPCTLCQKTWEYLYENYLNDKNRIEAVAGSNINWPVFCAMTKVTGTNMDHSKNNSYEKTQDKINDNSEDKLHEVLQSKNEVNNHEKENEIQAICTKIANTETELSCDDDLMKCIDVITKKYPFKLVTDKERLEQLKENTTRIDTPVQCSGFDCLSAQSKDSTTTSAEDQLYGEVLHSMLKNLPIKQRNEAKLDIFLLVTKLQCKHLS